MTRIARLTLSALALGMAATGAAAGGTSASAFAGVEASEWRNPRNSVHIRAHRCGESLCGTISWASDKAQADARKKGVTNLVGTQIFRNFQPAGTGTWKGKVYVPDMGRTFSGTLAFSGDTMVGKGCVAFGLLCKAQTWSRLR
jgi:uncharacterized protein (DUF2147 family)